MNITLSEVDTMKNTLVIGSDLRKETPILAHRVKKSADSGALINSINAHSSEYHFKIDQDLSTDNWVNNIGLVLKAAINLTKNHLPNNIADHLDLLDEPTAEHEKVAASMCQDKSLIILGLNAYSNHKYQLIRSYVHILASILSLIHI